MFVGRNHNEAAGLDWSEAQHHLGEAGWEDILEENRLAMYDAGLWGVPSFRLLGPDGEQLLAREIPDHDGAIPSANSQKSTAT